MGDRDRCRLLVCCVDLVCESGDHNRAVHFRYLRGDPTPGRAPFVVSQFAGALAACYLARGLFSPLNTSQTVEIARHRVKGITDAEIHR